MHSSRDEYHTHRHDNHRSEPPSKRYRRDEEADPTNPNPSIVVHVRNLNPKASEADLLEALSSFGHIAYATCIPHSRMALVEFETLEGSRNCVEYAQSHHINVGGQMALFNYSTSQCIERMGFESATPNKVLVLTVLNAQYPIDADVIHQICAPQGNVIRIAVMHKPTVVQALVEFENAEIAKLAKYAMNGADIYSGCCTLKVEFARPEAVRVTRQDKDQRDYTLPNSEGNFDGPSRKILIQSKPEFEKYNDRRCPPANDAYGSYSRYGGYDDRSEMYGDRGPPRNERFDDYYDRSSRAAIGGPGCVLMVYGIDHEKINCDKLFNILCQYGNVIRISFMRSKVETGIIEMGTPDERENVLKYMQNFEFFGLRLEFKPSHQDCVHSQRDPFMLPDETPSFRDYTESRNQRFTTPELAAKNRIIFPTNVLHWFNAPGTMDEAAVEKMISEKTEHKPIKIDVFPSRNERSAAGTAEFENVEIANEVLALVNHSPIDSPYGPFPFIVKWAYATPRKWEGNGGEPSSYKSYDSRENGFREDYRERRPSHSSSSYRRGESGGFRGRGSRGSYRGGYRSDDRFGYGGRNN